MQQSKILYLKGLINNLKMLTQSQIQGIKFIAKLENIKGIFASLKAINFSENAVFQITEQGLRVIVQESKYVQASVYITKECFSEYKASDEEAISFGVSLSVVTECLSIFAGVECSMKMLYKGTGAPLMLILEHHGEDDLITECSIRTRNHDEPLDFGFDDDGPTFNLAIIRGPELANIFNEIDKSAEELEIFLSSKSPYFRISTIGVMQSESNVEVAKSSDMMLTFTCRATTCKRYKLSHIKLAGKALLQASKVAIRTEESGLLSFQLMILSEGAAQIYIEFFIAPLVDCDD